jgi:hypothetical protein
MRIFLPRLLFLYDFFFLYLLLGLVRATVSRDQAWDLKYTIFLHYDLQ